MPADSKHARPLMKIGAVVLLHDNWPAVTTAIDALLLQTTPPAKIMVVDNASEVDHTPALRARYPSADVRRAHANRGYAAGMNFGILAMNDLQIDAFLLLTHDCQLDRLALARLADAMTADPELGVVGPLLGFLSDERRVFSAGGDIDPITWRVRHLRSPPEMTDWAEEGATPVSWLDGSCLLVRRDVLAAAGHLDERFFLYYEDVEFCVRIRRTGFSVACVPTARAWQEPSGGLNLWVEVQNRLLLMLIVGAPRRAIARDVLIGAREVVAACLDHRAGRAGDASVQTCDPPKASTLLMLPRGLWRWMLTVRRAIALARSPSDSRPGSR